jgi:hypothetical protein
VYGTPNLDALNRHIAERAKTHGLLAEAALVELGESDDALSGHHVKITLMKPALPRPLIRTHQVSVHRFEQVGVSVFDAFILQHGPLLAAE